MLQGIRLRSFFVGASLSLFLLLGAGFFTQAQAKSCTRLGSGAWSDATFWGGDCNSISDVPGSGDTVTVGSGAVFLDTDVSISGLSVSVGAEVDALANALMVTSTSVVTGAVTSTSGALTFQGEGGTLVPLTIAATGSVSSTSGLISASTTSIVAGGVLANNAGDIYVSGDLTNAGTIYIAGAGTLTLDGSLANTGSIPAQGTFALGGGGTVSIDPRGASFGALNVNKTGGTASFISKLNLVGSLLVAGGTLDVSAAGGADIGGSNTVNLGATFDVGSGTSTSFSVLDNGSMTITTGGSVTTTGSFDIGAAPASLSLGALPSAQGVIDVGITFTNGGTVSAQGGRIYVSGNFVSSGTFFPGVGTVILAGTADQSLGGTSFYNVLVDKSAGTVTKSASATVGGAFTVAAGTAAVELNAQNLIVSGDTTIGSGAAVTSTSGALVFGDAPAADLFISTGAVSSTSGVILFNSAVVNNVASVIGTNTGSITFNGTVLNSGTVSLDAGTASSTDTFTNEALGVMNLGTGAVTSTAVFTNDGVINAGASTFESQSAYLGSGTFNAGTSLFRTSGTANRNFNLAEAYNFENNVTSGGRVNMTRNLAIAGTYTSAGLNTLDADTFDLSFASLTTIGASTVVTSTTGTIDFSGTVVNSGDIGTLSGNLRFTGLLSNLGAGSTIHLGSGNATTTNTFSNEGTFFLESGHATTTNVITNQSSGIIDGGTSGFLELDGVGFLGAGGSNWSGNGTLLLSGSSIGGADIPGYSGYHNIIVDKTVGDVTISGDASLGGALSILSATVLDMTSNNLAVAGATAVVAGATLSTTSASLSLGAITNAGSITASSGLIRATDTTVNSGDITNTSGATTLVGLTNTGTVHFGSGIATTTGAVANNAGTIFIQSGHVTTTASWTNASGATVTGGSGTLDFNGTAGFTNAAGATFTRGTGRVILSGAGSATFSGATYNNLTMGKISGTVSMASSTAIAGTFTTSGGGTLDMLTRDLSVTGASAIGSGTTVTSTSGVLTFTGAVTNAGSIGTISGNQLYVSTLVNSGSLHLGSGSATTTDALTNGGTIYGETGVLSVSSTWSNAGTFSGGSGTVNLVAQSGQTIPDVTFYDLNVRTTGGAATSTGYTSVSGTFAVVTSTTFDVSTYTLNAPNGYTNAGTVVLGSGGLVVHPNTGYVFTDGSGTTASTVAEGAGVVYLTLMDANRNLLGDTVETISVTVTVGSDSEAVTLTETGASTGIFRNATGKTLSAACTPTASNGTIEVAATSGSLSSTYADNVDSADTSTDTVSFTSSASCGGGGGGGGGGGATSAGSGGGATGFLAGSGFPTSVSVTSPSLTTTPVTPSAAPVTPSEIVVLPPPSARVLTLLSSDARTFGVVLSESTRERLSSFIENGTSDVTRRLGEGERRAVVRDLLDTMHRDAVTLEDLERVSSGQIPLQRNLERERAQLPRVRQTFRTIYGHDPNFQNAEENLAWNTLMYRIRFSRDLTLERTGITEFRRIFRRSPSDPFQWAAVRALGYVQR